MSTTLHRRIGGRKPKENLWRIPWWVKLFVLILTISQIIAHYNYSQEMRRKNQELQEKVWNLQNQEPKVIEKIKEKVIEKRVYINRSGQDVTPIVEYTQKKFGNRSKIALAIFNAESGLRADAQNINADGSVDRGIAQINSCHCGWVDCSRLLNWEYNIDVAYQLSRGGTDWSQWTTYRTGTYRKYLDYFE